MDFTSLKPANYHPTNLYRNRFELRGQSCNISHRSDQRWYYLEGQKNSEVTFIKIWDNKPNVSAKGKLAPKDALMSSSLVLVTKFCCSMCTLRL